MLLIMSPFSAGQDDGKEHGDSGAKASATKPTAAYQVEFKLNEIEDGKRINSRSYSMLAQGGGALDKLRIGARVPVPVGSWHAGPGEANLPVNSQYQYLDAGMNIDCQLWEQEGGLAMRITVDSSTFTHPAADSPIKQPVVNQLRFELSTDISLGKPTVITSVDDLGSKRQFQLEVTVGRPK
jgi:hypothetical protein